MGLKKVHKGWQYPEDYLNFLYTLIKDIKPKKIVEIGTRYGDTSMVMASALKDSKSIIKTYDQTISEYIDKNIKLNNFEDVIFFKQQNFNNWLDNPEDFDVLYVDVDNTYEKIYHLKENKFIKKQNKLVIFEAARFSKEDTSIIFESKFKPYKLGKL